MVSVSKNEVNLDNRRQVADEEAYSCSNTMSRCPILRQGTADDENPTFQEEEPRQGYGRQTGVA